MFLDFIYNISLLVAVSVLYAFIPHQRLIAWDEQNPIRYRMVSGVLIGSLGIMVMFHSLQFAPGVVFDTRSVILCVAAVIFGPLTACIAGLMCVLFRLWMGGAGALVGVSVIVESVILGSVYYFWRMRDNRLNRFLPVYTLGLLVHGIMIVCMLGMPDSIRFDVIRRISVPVLLLYPVGVVLLCRIFFEIEARRVSEYALVESERKYRELVELADSIVLRWKPDGTIVFVNDYFEKCFGWQKRELLGSNILGTILKSRDSQGSDLAFMLRQVAAQPEAFTANECECRRRDGALLWICWSNKRLNGTSGDAYEVLSIGHDITRRRTAEEQLARSEEQYRRIVETVNEGIWSVDRNFITTFVNHRLCDMLGCPAEDILGHGLHEFILPQDVSAYADGTDQCRCTEAGVYERRFVRGDGSMMWALVSAMPVYDAEGAFAGSLATLTDITQQKENASRIERSEAKLQALFNNMSQGVFYQSADGVLTDINPAGLAMFGLTMEEFLRRTSHSPQWHVIDESGQPIAADQHPSIVALRTGNPVTDRIVGVGNARTGEITWMVVNAIPQFYNGGTVPSEVFVTLHDITNRVKAQKLLAEREEQVRNLYEDVRRSRKVLLSILEDDRMAHDALHESEERFRSVVETATDAIITVDGDGNIIVWNRAASQVFGYDYDEIIGKPFALLFPPDIEHHHIVGILNAIEREVLPSPLKISEAVGLMKDGNAFPAEIAFGAVVQKGCTLITAIVRDITERKLIEQEALRAAQLVSIGELAAGVAHEINNPIMGVINYAQILLNKISKLGGETEIPEKIIKEGTRIAGIVKNLLNFSRSADENIYPVAVRDVFDPSFQLVQKLFQKAEAAVYVRLSDDLPRVLVRPQKIQQVFINLLSNALYALNTRFPEPHSDKKLEIWSENIEDDTGFFVRVVFFDHGCGIDPEHISRICNPFFTTKPTGQGTGLGLSISHTIIREHGGRIFFESEVGQYTRVMVDLPAVKE